MDKWNYLSLFLIAFSLSEIANKMNVNLNLNEMGAFQHTDNIILTSIVSTCYVIAIYCLLHIFVLAEKEAKKLNPHP